MPARFRSCHLRLRRYVACSRGSAQSFGPTHGRGETESAPVHLRPPDINAHVRRRSWGARLATPVFVANSLTTCQASLSVTPSPQDLPALLTRRNTLPPLIPAASIHVLSSQ